MQLEKERLRVLECKGMPGHDRLQRTRSTCAIPTTVCLSFLPGHKALVASLGY